MTEDELAHYGVLGMKWGQRRTASAKQIKAARRRLKAESSSYRSTYKKYENAKTAKTKKRLEDRLRKSHQEYLKNPDRAIASRMTRGEKAAALFFGAETGPTFAVSAATIAGTSLVSRRIEQKQESGAYNKAPTGAVRKRIGAQTARTLTVNGALMAPGILRYVGRNASARIIMKAGANRNAAKIVKPSAIGAAADKIKYIKPGIRGAYKITTMK